MCVHYAIVLLSSCDILSLSSRRHLTINCATLLWFNQQSSIHGTVDHNKMKLIVIIWLAFIIVSSCLFDGASGHGSHQHMGKHHDHYVPKVERGAVHSVLDEKKLIQDTEWVVNLELH